VRHGHSGLVMQATWYLCMHSNFVANRPDLSGGSGTLTHVSVQSTQILIPTESIFRNLQMMSFSVKSRVTKEFFDRKLKQYRLRHP
jgi:hypothetical protein